MQEIPFTITVNGLAKIDAGKIIINLESSRTTINLEPSSKTDARSFLRKGQTIFDIILKTAQDFVASEGKDTRFSAADLYHIALDNYPYLKRNSWTSHVVASSSNHPSQRHYGVKRDYFVYTGKGVYKLKPEYIPENEEG